MSQKPKLKSTSSRSMRDFYLVDSSNKEPKKEDKKLSSSKEPSNLPAPSPASQKRDAPAPAASAAEPAGGESAAPSDASGGGGGSRIGSEGRKTMMMTASSTKMRSTSSRSLRTWAVTTGDDSAASGNTGGGAIQAKQAPPSSSASSSSSSSPAPATGAVPFKSRDLTGETFGPSVASRTRLLANAPGGPATALQPAKDEGGKKARSTSSRSLKQYMLEKEKPSAAAAAATTTDQLKKRAGDGDGDASESRSRSKTFKFLVGSRKEKEAVEEDAAAGDKAVSRLKRTTSWGRKESEKVKTVVKAGSSKESTTALGAGGRSSKKASDEIALSASKSRQTKTESADVMAGLVARDPNLSSSGGAGQGEKGPGSSAGGGGGKKWSSETPPKDPGSSSGSRRPAAANSESLPARDASKSSRDLGSSISSSKRSGSGIGDRPSGQDGGGSKRSGSGISDRPATSEAGSRSGTGAGSTLEVPGGSPGVSRRESPRGRSGRRLSREVASSSSGGEMAKDPGSSGKTRQSATATSVDESSSSYSLVRSKFPPGVKEELDDDSGRRKRSVSVKTHLPRSPRREGRVSLGSSDAGYLSPRGARANPAVPQAVLSAVAAIGQASLTSREARARPMESSSSSCMMSASLSSLPPTSSSGSNAKSAAARSPRGNSRSRGESAGSGSSSSSSPSASPRGRRTSPRSEHTSPQSSPRDKSSPRGLTGLRVSAPSPGSSSSSSSSSREAPNASSPRGLKTRMRSTRNVNATDAALAAGARKRRKSVKKSRGASDSQERRLKRERDVMGAEAQALTKNINQGVTSLLNNVYQLDYGEVMKLRTSVREWTGEVDRVFERMRKEFSVTPAGV